MNNVSTVIEKIKKTAKVGKVDATENINGLSEGDRRANLGYSLSSLLSSLSAIPYFVEFMASIGKLNLVQFWLALETWEEASDAGTTMELYSRYVDRASDSQVDLPEEISEAIQARIREGPMGMATFVEAKSFVYSMFHLRYFEEFQFSAFGQKHEFDVFNNPENIRIEDIIHCQVFLPILLELVDCESDRNSIQFLLAVDTWKDQLPSMSDEEAMSDAVAIYDRFLSLQAVLGLNLPDSFRSETESGICTVDGRPDEKAFSRCRLYCLRALERKYKDRMIYSSEYSEYLSYLRGCVERETKALVPVKPRPAAPVTKTEVSRRLSLPPHLTVNSESGSRSSARSSKLGEVDELGRYHTLFDNSLLLTSSTPQKLKKTLRKYVDKSLLREEEMAEDVARSIIEDVHQMVVEGGKGLGEET